MSNNRDVKLIAGTAVALTVLLPVCDCISTLVSSAVNKILHRWNLDMQLDEAEAQAASEVIAPAPAITQAIGFEIPPTDDGGVCYDKKSY